MCSLLFGCFNHVAKRTSPTHQRLHDPHHSPPLPDSPRVDAVMSDSQSNPDGGVVPFQPVDVKDRHGLASAVYAINALYLRSGKQPIEMLEVRARVAALVRDADAKNLALLLQEWYQETIDAASAEELLENLPQMIEADDNTRYKLNPIVNDIEWSALATIYRCCIAVKFLTNRKSKTADAKQFSGWKIAVPTPKVFGSKAKAGTSNTEIFCVFVVCHSSPKLSTYVALIPCEQEVFSPGRSLLAGRRLADKQAQTKAPTQEPENSTLCFMNSLNRS